MSKDEDLCSIFIDMLSRRLENKRKTSDYCLSHISHGLVYAIAIERSLKDILDVYIEDILSDCEIYYNMDKDKAFDAVIELSNLAAVYTGDRYEKICQMIQSIRISYSVN